MKDESQKLVVKLLASPFAGAVAAVLCIVLMMLFAWMFSANYEYLAQPLAAMHNIMLPDISFGQWVAVAVLVGAIKLTFAPMPRSTPDTQDVDKAINRIGTIFTYCILPYLINWIFL